MKTSIDCIPCFVRQTLEATRYVSADPSVRGGPVINDATINDVYAAGLHEIVMVTDNGSDAPRIILSNCSPEFQRHFKEAGLIIAKGQGNYKTLSDESANIFFLFKIKCAVMASNLGLEPGTNVLTKTLKTKRAKRRRL